MEASVTFDRGVANRIVGVKDSKNLLGLFSCSSIQVGQGMAGEWYDTREGAVVAFSDMTGVVTEEEAKEWMDKLRNPPALAPVNEGMLDNTILLSTGFKMMGNTKSVKNKGGIEVDADKDDLSVSKKLFSCKEYDAIKSFTSRVNKRFRSLSIPAPFRDSMFLVNIGLVERLEEECTNVQLELGALVEEFVAAYPGAVEAAAGRLRSLYATLDYKRPEDVRSAFGFTRRWLEIQTPTKLNSVSSAFFNEEKKRTENMWKEAQELGQALLRQEMAKMVARLVESLSPGPDGKKKKFYTSAITNMTDFFEVFDFRNISGDKELQVQVDKLKVLVEGRDIKEFKEDDKLRDFVKARGQEIGATLDTMLVAGGARSFSLED